MKIDSDSTEIGTKGVGLKAETHDETNRGDTSLRQVTSSELLLRQVASEFGRGEILTSFQN